MENIKIGSPPSTGAARPWLQRLLRLLSPLVAPAQVLGPSGDASPPRKAPPPGLTVLVADDNPLNRMLAAEMLLQLGMQPIQAADGAEAVALAAELRLDLILMDLQMPVLDGLAATRQIRHAEQQTARPRVPVVAYSSLTGDAAWLARLGFNDALPKPCELRALQDCLLRWCTAEAALARPATRFEPLAREGMARPAFGPHP